MEGHKEQLDKLTHLLDEYQEAIQENKEDISYIREMKKYTNKKMSSQEKLLLKKTRDKKIKRMLDENKDLKPKIVPLRKQIKKLVKDMELTRTQLSRIVPTVLVNEITSFLGGKKRSKKSIRKHSGINQSTGRLKRGYKYSGKKLKSGLSQIVKF